MQKADSFPFSYSQGTVRATSNTSCNCNTNSHLVVALDFKDAETGLVEYHCFPHATLTMELCNLTGPTGEETLVHDEVTPNLLASWFPVSVLTRHSEQGHSRVCRIFLLQKIVPNHCPKMETKEKVRQIWYAHVPCTYIGATPLWTSTGAINPYLDQNEDDGRGPKQRQNDFKFTLVPGKQLVQMLLEIFTCGICVDTHAK